MVGAAAVVEEAAEDAAADNHPLKRNPVILAANGFNAEFFASYSLEDGGRRNS